MVLHEARNGTAMSSWKSSPLHLHLYLFVRSPLRRVLRNVASRLRLRPLHLRPRLSRFQQPGHYSLHLFLSRRSTATTKGI